MSNDLQNSVPKGFYDLQPPRWIEEGPNPNPTRYALSGKIMLSAVVILFLVILLMASLHLYARWYLIRIRRRSRQRRTHFIFYVEPNTTGVVSRGLDPTIIDSLPIFPYNPSDPPIDCAVCLSEFVSNESGLRLPKCGHAFHVECINMWFKSHSNCPLCRAMVEKSPVTNESASSSSEEIENGVAKAAEVSVDVPGVSSLDCEMGSPTCKMPVGGRMMSLRRMFSRAGLSPTTANCATESREELDAIERGQSPRPVSE